MSNISAYLVGRSMLLILSNEPLYKDVSWCVLSGSSLGTELAQGAGLYLYPGHAHSTYCILSKLLWHRLRYDVSGPGLGYVSIFQCLNTFQGKRVIFTYKHKDWYNNCLSQKFPNILYPQSHCPFCSQSIWIGTSNTGTMTWVSSAVCLLSLIRLVGKTYPFI